MSRFLLSFVGLLAVGLASADNPSLGRYKLRMTEDAARVARLAGKEGAFSGLTLHANGRFLLETGGAVRRGDFRVREDRLTLRVEDGSELRGEVRNGEITLEGLQFEHVRGASARRFPTDASTGRLDRDETPARFDPPVRVDPPFELAKPLPVVIPAFPDLTTVFKDTVVKVPVAPALKPLDAKEIAGAWTVWRNGREEKSQRMTLKADGTFGFKMVNASSEGTWTVEGRNIVLVWTKIDGEPIEEPGSMRKEIPVGDDGASFKIDTYQYGRATS